jgi:hypothetical protein
MSRDGRMGYRHFESHGPFGSNVTDESWGPTR